MHSLVARRADREMYLGTFFLRNRPALELMRRLVQTREDGAPIRIAVLGCSIGVEVYSIVWTLRRSQPNLQVSVEALTSRLRRYKSASRAGTTRPRRRSRPGRSSRGLARGRGTACSTGTGRSAPSKRWLHEGITWRVGDASDPCIADLLGLQDIVGIANNSCVICQRPLPTRALRNIGTLVSPNGYLFVTGVGSGRENANCGRAQLGAGTRAPGRDPRRRPIRQS